ncbi:protein of unknown function [Vibrio tapetis subsp. tapetis]|uniref:Uncharacterized protein n=1 Tax=Vibrio tapetis subsp. tapetis TaxID=1671868 RepID=A0A2N8ZMI3_9VIBR|nr:protein of unknown function [Vibrio tapetis subsp. tapetis]
MHKACHKWIVIRYNNLDFLCQFVILISCFDSHFKIGIECGRKAERQKGRKAERQKGRKAERQKGRKAERQKGSA